MDGIPTSFQLIYTKLQKPCWYFFNRGGYKVVELILMPAQAERQGGGARVEDQYHSYLGRVDNRGDGQNTPATRFAAEARPASCKAF